MGVGDSSILGPVAPRASRRDLLPSALVLAILFVATFGGYLVAAALSEPQGTPVTVPGLVTVRPLSGWSTSIARSTSGDDVPLLSRGGGNLAVFTSAGYTGTSTDLASDYRQNRLSPTLSRLSVSSYLRTVTLAGGLTGARFGYAGFTAGGVGVQGEVTAVVGPHGGIVFDGRAAGDLLPFITGDLHTMIAQADLVNA
jgi:hypothetical protein